MYIIDWIYYDDLDNLFVCRRLKSSSIQSVNPSTCLSKLNDPMQAGYVYDVLMLYTGVAAKRPTKRTQSDLKKTPPAKKTKSSPVKKPATRATRSKSAVKKPEEAQGTYRSIQNCCQYTSDTDQVYWLS